MPSTTKPPLLLPPDNGGECLARHYQSGEVLRASWDSDGILTELEPAPKGDPENRWIAPGLIDLQVNGYAGVDLQRPLQAGVEELRKLADALKRDGCTRFFPTLITAEWPALLNGIRHLRPLIESDARLKRALAGWHIEGPFLSDQPGYSGAHNPAWMRDPDAGAIRELREAAGDAPILLTLAPERPGSAEAIATARELGMMVSLGHTCASPDEVARAMTAGARAFTHLGNGCPQSLDRHENVIWTALDRADLTIGIIPDGIHVAPAAFRLFHKAKEPTKIYWTTDAMSAAGAPPGRYTLGEIELEVGEDRIVRNPATRSFAGSALSPIEGIRRGAAMLGYRWQDVWDYFSTHPAKLAGLPGELATGSPAGFCLLRSR